MWDVDSARTSALFQDMGVSVLPDGNSDEQIICMDNDDDDHHMSSPNQPTPQVTMALQCQPPPVCMPNPCFDFGHL